jgi:CRISPR-associated protein Cas5t
MEFLRVAIRSWMSSFRYPKFQVGYQPSLPVPPPSTILGLLSAAKGEIVKPEEVSFGYLFFHELKGVDIEKVYELGRNRIKTNILRREILFNCNLYLYVDDFDFAEYFKRPHYQLLLGRSTDLAQVHEIKKVELKEEKGVSLGYTPLPLELEIAGIVQLLPISISASIPRKIEKMRPFVLVTDFYPSSRETYYDAEKKWGIWIHERSALSET